MFISELIVNLFPSTPPKDFIILKNKKIAENGYSSL